MIINGNLNVLGYITTNSLLLPSIYGNINDLTNGLSIDVVNGNLYYKVSQDVVYKFPSETIIHQYIEEKLANVQASGQTVVASEEISIEDILYRSQWGFFDGSQNTLINLTFLFSQKDMKLSYVTDKLYFTKYQNKRFEHKDYQFNIYTGFRSISNEDVLPNMKCRFLDFTPLFSEDLEDFSFYFNEFFISSFSNNDITDLLDACYGDNTVISIFDTSIAPMFYFFSLGNALIDRLKYNNLMKNIIKNINTNSNIVELPYGQRYNIDSTENQRTKIWFFDYNVFVQFSHLFLLDSIKNRQNRPMDFSDELTNVIIQYKIDTDKTQFFDITGFDFYANVVNIYNVCNESNFEYDLLYNSDTSFSIYLQNINSLNDYNITSLDVDLITSAKQSDGHVIKYRYNLDNIMNGNFKLPLYEMNILNNAIAHFIL